jgi:hypothetical protein
MQGSRRLGQDSNQVTPKYKSATYHLSHLTRFVTIKVTTPTEVGWNTVRDAEGDEKELGACFTLSLADINRGTWSFRLGVGC